MLINAAQAKAITVEGLKLRKVAEEVNGRIKAAARVGYGHINASPNEIHLLEDWLLDSGYRINGNYIIWYDETADNRKEEEEEDEW